MRWKWLGIAALLFVSLIQAKYAISSPKNLDSSYSGIPLWMRSAECARTEKFILVLCDGGRVRPIADQNAGEDPGHALFLDLYAAISGRTITPADVVILNAVVNWIGLVILAGLLLSLHLPFVSMTLLALGPLVSSQFQWLSPHTAQFGATCLAMIAPLVILTASEFRSRRGMLTWLAAGIVCLAFASLLRQSLGLMGLVAGALAAIVMLVRGPRTIRRLALFATVLLGLLAAYKVPSMVLSARNYSYGLQPSEYMETHGIWHNLYIGLGVVKNPWGIVWLDDIGFAHAKAIVPDVKFTTKQYYDVLRGAYFDIVTGHPWTVARIYIEKFANGVANNAVWLMLIAAIAPAWILRRGVVVTRHARRIDSVLAISGLFICFFLGQAALFHWAMVYRYPIIIPIILILGTSFEMFAARKEMGAGWAAVSEGASNHEMIGATAAANRSSPRAQNVAE